MELDPKYDHYDYPTTAPETQSGHPGHTTSAQNAQVFQLRTQLEQAGYKERLDTHTMVRDSQGWDLPSLTANSYGSCVPESSMLRTQRRCMSSHPHP